VDWQEGSMPKKLEKIKNGSREWAIADVAYWENKVPRGPTRRAGTWPFDQATGENSGAVTRGEMINYPYHLTSAGVNQGRLNASFFDGHGASVRVWEGTVNPCFDDSPKDTNCDTR
jgi:prepilin-type processing-associated H-X9-DG protein